MSTLQEIEAAIEKLPREEAWKLTDWLVARRNDEWDRQMEEDAKPGGPLDQMAREAIAEYRTGKTRPLP